MTPPLESLSDSALSEAVAIEVLGRDVNEGMMRGSDQKSGNMNFESWMAVPTFATSADAVLPFLQKCDWVNLNFTGEAWHCEVDLDCAKEIEAIAHETTFARAACIALLKAARANKK